MAIVTHLGSIMELVVLKPGRQERGVLREILGDGTPLLMLTGLCLIFAGGFALFLCATGEFLPHDRAYLGISAQELCGYFDGRVYRFMVHDRAAFGGSIISVGAIYLWLAYYPLRDREAWAWWLFLVSGALGFGSFLTYLVYGYLDTWHAAATIGLLAVFLTGMIASYRALGVARKGIACLGHRQDRDRPRFGECLLLLTGIGMMGGGLTILTLGSTEVFVPQDLAYMKATRADLNQISDRLIPLIAHDRAGFGGGIATTGIIVFCTVWCGHRSLSRWQTLLFAGTMGFVCAIGIHYVIGYTDIVHLAPAWLGFLIFSLAMAIHYGEVASSRRSLPE